MIKIGLIAVQGSNQTLGLQFYFRDRTKNSLQLIEFIILKSRIQTPMSSTKLISSNNFWKNFSQF